MHQPRQNQQAVVGPRVLKEAWDRRHPGFMPALDPHSKAYRETNDL
jgi:hypothetical protein